MCLRTSFKIQQRAEKYTTGQTWHFLIRHEETVKHIFTGKKVVFVKKRTDYSTRRTKEAKRLNLHALCGYCADGQSEESPHK